MIARKKFSAAYEYLLEAYAYIICDDKDEEWTVFPVQDEWTTVHIVAFRSVLHSSSGLCPIRSNKVNELFDVQSSKMCLDYEADFVRAFCHTVVENTTFFGDPDFILEDGLPAINRYLKRFPKSDAALYLKAKLIYASSLSIETRESEALALLNTALTLKRTSRSQFLKAIILERQQERNKDVHYQNDEPVLIMLDLCTTHVSCLAAWKLLQRYANEHRGINLPNPNDNKTIFWFDHYDESYFLGNIEKALKSSYYEPNLTSEPRYTREPDYKSIDTTKARQEINELINTLITNRLLFTNDSYKQHIGEYNRDEAEKEEIRYQERLDRESEEQGYDNENSYYDEDLDMD